jgi:pyridoxamine 5'-phosphate oxidase
MTAEDSQTDRPSPTREMLRGLHALAGPFKRDHDSSFTHPAEMFVAWLRDAIAAGQPEPHAMTLSTVDTEGCPDARVLILKDVDADHWSFASTRTGPKGLQIAANPNVALTFYWPLLGRQVRVRGEATDLGAAVGAADFHARSREARAVALMERQSDALDRPEQVEAMYNRQLDRLAADPELTSARWAAYAVAPREVEFWQGSEDRRHWRLRFTREGAAWRKTLLWP